MSKRNENRPGYRKAKVGWIPDSWNVFIAEKIFEIKLGKMLSKKARQGNNPKPYLANYNVQWGYFDLGEVQEMDFTEKEMEKYHLSKGDLLVCEGGEAGRCAVWEEQIKHCFYQKALHRVRPRIDNINVYFVMYFLHQTVKSPRMVHFTSRTSISHFTREQFLKFPIALPPLPEQKKIAEILSTWDEAIEQTRKLIDAKKLRKKALIQQLLSGKKRSSVFREDSSGKPTAPLSWELVRAKDLFINCSKKNFGHERVLSVTQNNGVVSRDSLDRKIETSESNTDTYKLVQPGDFVISLRSFQGGLEYSKYRGIVSPAYHVIRPKKQIDDLFFKYYFKSYDFIGHLAVAVIGIRDGKQVSFNDFSFMDIPYPPLDEQKRISKILNTADKEIQALEKKLSALEKQKRGLMQKLLTGEVRVKP